MHEKIQRKVQRNDRVVDDGSGQFNDKKLSGFLAKMETLIKPVRSRFPHGGDLKKQILDYSRTSL